MRSCLPIFAANMRRNGRGWEGRVGLEEVAGVIWESGEGYGEEMGGKDEREFKTSIENVKAS